MLRQKSNLAARGWEWVTARSTPTHGCENNHHPRPGTLSRLACTLRHCGLPSRALATSASSSCAAAAAASEPSTASSRPSTTSERSTASSLEFAASSPASAASEPAAAVHCLIAGVAPAACSLDQGFKTLLLSHRRRRRLLLSHQRRLLLQIRRKVQEGEAAPQPRPQENWIMPPDQVSGLEKALVELLHDHNNDCYRSQNAWSTEAWNRIVKLVHEKFPYVKFTKVQIQDKERELKREYRVLKEARQQSGASWDDKLCRIVADQPVWDKILSSHPKAKKFQNESFPLFEALGELYDGQTAEGTLNFTSIAPSQVPITQLSHVPLTQPSQAPLTQPSQVPVTQPSQVPVTQPSQAPVTQHYIGEDENFPFDSSVHNVETDDDELRILEQPVASGAAARSRMGKRVASATSNKTEKAARRRRQDGKVVEMMGRFIEMKEKQESMRQERARSNQHEDEFLIPVCIAVVDKMEDLSDDEKVEAYDVFKDPQNRAIFMTAKDSTRLKWLRKKIRTA
ncbi:unnamed protein product [Miscanthus lutarioriparius]|uniref:Myb/SANT-like domain-containing protein n=1 Tax=Miscanthus lutarioriparius TaxID=422564 RepID=A0A811QY44_9POAL|nr:unnamed protein product [Miscanthus lutarioriparius]